MLAKWMLTSVVVLGLGAPMWAEDPDEDGPGRGVARISVINGDVSVKRGDSGEFVAAALNAPLVVEDRVYTSAGSRAELQFDWANMLRVSSNAEVRLAEVEYRRYIVQIARGTVTWRVLRDQEAYVEVSTPSVSVRPVKRGEYRVTVHDDGTSEITVRSGEAEVFTPRGSERLRSGRTMLARGTTSEPEFQVVSEIREDEWDRWNEYRDKDLERSRSYTYVSRDIYGAEDLDNHGRWVYVPTYGWVWSPQVAAGWAPYRYGRWSWIDYYGWSWVSYDPWGWAPYHYGRWFHHGPYGWCWWPGGVGRRHYWSPGFVAFFGFGRGSVGIGMGWGNVGWVPLAPYEPFHRWWGRGWYGGYRNRTVIDNRMTVVNNVNITNIYRNSRINNAITGVDPDGFRRGRSGGALRVSNGELTRAALAQGPLPVAPDRTSLRLADREPAVRAAESRGSDRFFSSRKPAQVERVSFDEQRTGVERIARRTFGDEGVSGGGSRGEMRTAERTGGATTEPSRGNMRSADAATPVDRGTAREAERGWRRMENTPSGSTPERPAETDRGWRRFGEPVTGRSSDAPAAVERRSDRLGTAERSTGRFGEPSTGRTDAPAAAEPSRTDRGDRSNGTDWRRFGDRSVQQQSEPSRTERGDRSVQRSEPSRTERFERNDNWRREQRVDPPSRTEAPRAVSPRGERPSRVERQSAPEPRYEAPRSERRSEPIRISPPMVRERGGDSGPRMSGGGDSGRGSMRSGGSESGGSVSRGESRGGRGR
jgi:hypothetical protein